MDLPIRKKMDTICQPAIGNRIVLDEIQELLNIILYSYMTSTSLTPIGIIFYPLFNKIARFNRFQKTVKILKATANRYSFLSFEKICERYLTTKKTKYLPLIIKEGYQVLNKTLSCKSDSVLYPCPAALMPLPNNDALLTRLFRMQNFIQESLSEDLCLMVVHESFAYGDFIPGYSDCDLYAIIKKDVLFSVPRLEKLRCQMIKISSYLYSMDFFQHHGVLLCTEIDLKAYPGNFLPLFLVARGRKLSGQCCNIIAFETKNKIALFKAFVSRVKGIRKLLEKKDLDLFSVKNLFQNMVMLPVNFYTLKDRRGIDKKEALSRFKKEYPELYAKALHPITRIRSEWPEYRSYPSNFSALMFHLNPEAYRFFMRIQNRQIDQWILYILGEGWIKRFSNFVEQVELMAEQEICLARQRKQKTST